MNIYLYHLTQDNIVKYVGLTQYINNTKSRHRRGKPSHIFEIIQTYHNREEAGIAEQYHIAGYKTFKDGWNGTIGGDRYLDWVDISGENNPNWKGGLRTNNPKLYKKEYDRKRPDRKAYRKEYNQRAEVKERMKNWHINERKGKPEAIAKKKENDRIRNQRPEVKERKNMLRKIRYARNREIEYFMLNGLVL